MHPDTFAQADLSALPPGAAGHYRLHLYAAIAHLLERLAVGSEGADDWGAAFPFLAGYRAALASYQPEGIGGEVAEGWWAEQVALWEEESEVHLPLRAVRDEMGLGDEGVRLLMTVALVEEDIRFGALFATLQAPLVARRPCVGLLGWLLGESGDGWATCRALLERGLLLAENRDEPRSEWLLRIPGTLWDTLRSGAPPAGMAALTWHAPDNFPEIEALILPADLHEQLARLPDMLAHGQLGALVLRGMSGSGRRTVLGSVARALGRGVLEWEGAAPGDEAWRTLGALATLAGALPLLRCQPGPGEAWELPLLPGYGGPVGLSLGRNGGLRGPLVERGLTLTLPAPDYEARRQFWLSTGTPLLPVDQETIAARFLLTGGNIHRVATIAWRYAQLDGRGSLAPSDVRQAARALNRQTLETLATPLDEGAGWDELIVSLPTARELQALATRCRERERLREGAGPAFERRLNRGVRALFSGPSGTGKTLAAQALAAALEMDLYRVDLAAVVNKYIGETERNLNLVLSRAEELDVVLLLDEGDALMTKRTEVRNANDRYANLETNYLLQRLESYEGIVLITTNAGQRIDTAFQRRLDAIIDFAPPEATERWLIWQRHLPVDHAVSLPYLDEVATRCALTGGQIRNAALHATLLALGGYGPLTDEQLEAALQREYRRAGAAYPLRPQAASAGQLGRLQRFAAELG